MEMSGQLDCLVCSRPSKPQKPNCGHYGVMSCMSCKVFFKRCHEEYFVNGDFSKYPCIKDNKKCVIYYEEPIRCKLCRYLKCLNLGMNPDRILDDQAKQKFCRIQYRNSLPKQMASLTIEKQPLQPR